jgi:hypothetical protein
VLLEQSAEMDQGDPRVIGALNLVRVWSVVEEHRKSGVARPQQGVPDDVVDLLTYLFSEVLDGRNAHLADGVERALGRQPRDFRAYVRRAAATGVWLPAKAA